MRGPGEGHRSPKTLGISLPRTRMMGLIALVTLLRQKCGRGCNGLLGWGSKGKTVEIKEIRRDDCADFVGRWRTEVR